MGDMADFCNEERMDEVEFLMDHDDVHDLYDAGHCDEFGFMKIRPLDLVPPGDPSRG